MTIDTNAAVPFGAGAESSAKLRKSGAAKDFEALLVAQMLRTVREADSGWMDGGEDGAAATAFGIGEQELSRAIAQGGGFGLSKLINSALDKAPAQADIEVSGTQGITG